MAARTFDVVIAGGGLAGSSLGGVLARSGLGVLVVEKETQFRDRIRGELSFPWGHYEATRAGLGDPLAQAGVVPHPTVDLYEDQRCVESVFWKEISLDGLPGIGFSHPRLQEVMLQWASSMGATVLRPAKVVAAVNESRGAEVTIDERGEVSAVQARLLVGADGKTSGARRWVGGESVADPEHHRFGGILLSDVTGVDSFGWASIPETAVGWLPTGTGLDRVYIRLTADRVRETGVARHADAFIEFASRHMPAGALDDAQPAGPIGFFANNCTWSSQIAQGHVVLVGDAAGSVDPTHGLGTSLLFRDVRALSELLMSETNWNRATAEFATQRSAYFEVLRAFDRWAEILDAEVGADADRMRDRHMAAREADPTLGGFGLLEARGPDGLVPDEKARRIYFGEEPLDPA